MRKFQRKKKYRPRKKRGGRQQDEGPIRVRMPRDKQVFGRVEQLHGGKRMMVRCSDNRRRMCRVPGKLKRIWVRTDDYVIVEPWSLDGDNKGDIAWKYRYAEVDWLKKRGHLKDL